MHTFAFVDIVGFTAYTARRGDAEAARLAVSVGKRIRALLPAYGAEEVKSLGDGMMIRATDPAGAVRLAARLAEDAEAGRLPRLRIGLDHGPAVNYGGDWYGATVNRAARLCAAARPGEVLVGAGVRAAVNGHSALAFRRRLGRVRDVPLRFPVYTALSVPEQSAPRPAAATGGCPAVASGQTGRGLLRRIHGFVCPRQTIEGPA